MKIGILREGKNPPDKRVPLSPNECRILLESYPKLQIFVQPSPIRCFSDHEYSELGINLKENLSECDILMGVKEVKVDDLISEKKYFFFSHTIKKQAHNRALLKAIIQKNIELIDYETLTYKSGERILGFGRYAGIVGAYNAILGYGLKYNIFNLKPAHLCKDKLELELELKKVKLSNIKIAVTGGGRVANGVFEILSALEIQKVSVSDFLHKTFDEPVYTQLEPNDYVVKKDGSDYLRSDFFKNPQDYVSAFIPYTKVTDLLITSHFWDPNSPMLFTWQDMGLADFKIKLISDITCDINGSVPSTIRATTIECPFYDIDVHSKKELQPFSDDNLTVMSIDNLPCELPRDSSEGFGNDLINKVLPYLLGSDPDNIIERATIVKNGELMPRFFYLSDYAATF